MEKSLTGTAWCKGSPVHYYLLAEKLENGTTIYGSSVAYLGETSDARGLTLSYGSVMHLLGLLRQGIVTPVTARDVVLDWLLDRD